MNKPYKEFLPPAVRSSSSYYQPGAATPNDYNYEYTPQLPKFPFQPKRVNGQSSFCFETPAEFSHRTGTQLVSLAASSNMPVVFTTKRETNVIVLSDELSERDDTVLYADEKKECVLCYFTITIKARIEKHSRAGMTNELEILVKSKQHTCTVVIELAKFHTLLTEIKTTNPQFRVNASFTNISNFFVDYAALKYNCFLASEVVKREYNYHGWELINGEILYLNDRLPFCKSGCYVWSVHPERIGSIYQSGHSFLSIGNRLEEILPIFLYAHIGFAARLFHDAGSDIQFLLLIVGRTGSFKTSLSKEIFQPFSTMNMLNFQSTPRAIELYHEAHQDMVMLLDDIFSAIDSSTLKKFEDLLRTIGDSASRAKSNKRSDAIERSDVYGGAVVTAESDLNSQQSSRLRYLTVPVDDTSFDSKKLQHFQKDGVLAKQQGSPSLMQMYFSAFIYFLEKNYNEIVKEIMDIESTLEPLAVKFPRLNTIYKAMVALARIVIRFGLVYNAMTETEATATLHRWEAVIQKVILLNQAESTTIEPYLAFLTALAQGIACKEIVLANDKATFFSGRSEYYGFYDQEKELLYLRNDKVFVYVQKYYSALGEKFDSTPSAIGKTLFASGISIADNEAGHKRTTKKVSNKKDSGSLRMLCIIQAAMYAKLAEAN